MDPFLVHCGCDINLRHLATQPSVIRCCLPMRTATQRLKNSWSQVLCSKPSEEAVFLAAFPPCCWRLQATTFNPDLGCHGRHPPSWSGASSDKLRRSPTDPVDIGRFCTKKNDWHNDQRSCPKMPRFLFHLSAYCTPHCLSLLFKDTSIMHTLPLAYPPPGRAGPPSWTWAGPG